MALSLNQTKRTSISADQSAIILTLAVQKQDPFFFLRYGDGALECIRGNAGMTRDHEIYSAKLGRQLLEAWWRVMGEPDRLVFVGDWHSASFDATSQYARYDKEYAALVGKCAPTWIHFEALLLMRETRELVDFYRAVQKDDRRKVYIGPAACAGAAAMLRADHIATPMNDLIGYLDVIRSKLAAKTYDVVLYGAGMAGHIPVSEWWVADSKRTAINIGSAMDPLFMGRTRRQQIDTARARLLFKDLLRTAKGKRIACN